MSRASRRRSSSLAGPRRFDDWPSRLEAVVDAARKVKFSYGTSGNDCCRFPADAVAAVTGVDHMAPFRGYRSKLGALRAIRRYGGGGLGEALERWSRETGVEQVPLALARRGDVVVHETPEGPALGICLGARFAAVKEPEGLVFFPMSAATAVWRV